MGNKNVDNVVLVFEPACDAHWMKDVVQFANALAQELYNKNALLITRPNHKQSELATHIHLEFSGNRIQENVEHFDTVNFSKIIADQQWYAQACQQAVDLGGTLILYPWFGDPFKGAKTFKIGRWLKFRKALVILKSDGLLQVKSNQKVSPRQRIKDKLTYLFIDKIIVENEQVFRNIQVNNPHLSSKIAFVPNCPLDIYHTPNSISYSERPNQFLFVGRIDDKEKGADILLNAWLTVASQIHGWKLEMAGPCSSEFKDIWLKKLNDNNLKDTVCWAGMRSPLELIHHYNNAKVVVCTSSKESGPIVLIEAILSGCAFIGTSVGEIPDVLKGLEGLVGIDNGLEKLMLHFAKNPEVAIQQSEMLFDRVEDRKWRTQIKKLV